MICRTDKKYTHSSNLLFLEFLYTSTIASRVSLDNESGPSIQIRIVCWSVSSPSLLRSLVFISFKVLNVRSTVAVVTGSTIRMEASFDRLGNAATISAEPAMQTKPVANGSPCDVQILLVERVSIPILCLLDQCQVENFLLFHQMQLSAHNHRRKSKFSSPQCHSLTQSIPSHCLAVGVGQKPTGMKSSQ